MNQNDYWQSILVAVHDIKSKLRINYIKCHLAQGSFLGMHVESPHNLSPEADEKTSV